jgi:hypothetical protein
LWPSEPKIISDLPCSCTLKLPERKIRQRIKEQNERREKQKLLQREEERLKKSQYRNVNRIKKLYKTVNRL